MALLMAGTMSAFAVAQGDQKVRSTPAASALRHVDGRLGLLGLHTFAPRDAQRAEVDGLRAELPDLRVEFDLATGATRSLWNMGGFLTPSDGRDPQAIAEDFMAGRAPLLGLSASDVADVELTDTVYSRLTGVTHLYYRQRLGGIPVYNAQLQVNITRDGRILSVNNTFLPGLTAAVPTLRPALDASTVVAHVAAHLGVADAVPVVELAARGTRHTTELAAPALSTEPITAELTLLPVERGAARLVWNLQVWTLDGQHAFDFTVDAETGRIWTRFDWVAADSYKVYPRPVESPNHTAPAPMADGRTLVTAHADAVASPFGWHDVNGVAGAEFTITNGNNVHAYTDVDANNLPDAGGSPDCGPGLTCDFPLSLASVPPTYGAAAVTNLFYWNNIIHDVQYRYGFDEAAGNFQVNTYGRGGAGFDSVQAEAQDGGGVNNANFATPPDGMRPRMQMYLWNTAAPGLDGDLDSGIIVHEYGHGISNRLVGGPSSVSCLGNLQQPGEGISDWLSLVYTARATDTAALARGIGTYVLNQPQTGAGIRPLRYSTDPGVNSWTYASISSGTLSVPHGVGAVWAQGMWKVYWALVGDYGFDPNLYDAMGGAGNQRAMLYHNEGLKFTSCSPGFTQVRDGIIQAAQVLHGGEDVCRLWSAFAAFGLGADAINPSPQSISGIVNGFDTPAACGGTANPNMTIDDMSVVEGDDGTTTATFTVTLASASVSETRVSYSTADGTARGSRTMATARVPTTIPSSGRAAPYPAALEVSGLSGPIVRLAVRVNGLSHSWPEDLDLLLVGPGGPASMFMSDIGGSAPVSNVDLTFSDGAPAPPVPLVTGTFAPTNAGGSESLPAPAPAGPYGAPLSVFNGTSPNGAWTLYTVDDTSFDGGKLDGFSLIITTTGGGDYVPASGELVFAPGSTTRTLSVPVTADTLPESDETFFVNLSNPVNATLVDAQGQGTIVNDDVGAPTTMADAYETPFDTELTVVAPGVLANDLPNGGGVMVAELVAGAAHGTLALGSDGAFVYTPGPGFEGADGFTYRAVSGIGPGNEVAVSLTVHPPTPVSLGDVYVSPVARPLVVPAPGVLANDLSWNGPMVAALVSGASSGAVTLHAHGGFSYTPAAGFVGTDHFTYRAVNEMGPGTVAMVTVTVEAPTTVQAPVNLRVEAVVGATVALRWDPPAAGPAPESYVVEGGWRPGEAATSLTTGNAAPVFVFTAPAGSFFVRVHAVDGTGRSAPSNEVPLHVNVPVAPSALVHLTGLANGSTLALAWKNTFGGGAPSGLVLDVAGSMVASIPLGPSESVAFTGVPAGTYTLSLRAQNAGGSSPSSNAVTLTFPGACSGVPHVPGNITAYLTGGTAYVVWDPPATGPAPTSYVLDVTGSLEGRFSTPRRLLSGPVGPGTYFLTVAAANACGTGAPSPVQVVTVP